MDHRPIDDRLDRLLTRYLAERHEEIVRDARPAAAVARRARPGPAGTLAYVLPGPRPARRLALAMLVAALVAALAAGAALVGAHLLPSTHDPLAGLETVEVAPGVHRVVRDGAGHDLAALGVVEIATGRDGAVWMNGHGGLFRLQRPGIADPEPSRWRTGLTVAPDGSVWSVSWHGPRSFDGVRWTGYPGLRVGGLAIAPDGSVWGATQDKSWVRPDGPQPPGFELVRLEDGRSTPIALTGWPDGHIGRPGNYAPELVATADGSLWMIAHGVREVLVRYDGSTWDVAPMPFEAYWIADGPDGSWVIVDRNVEDDDGETRIARFATGAWSESSVRLTDATAYWAEDVLPPTVAADGAVWLRVNRPGSPPFPERCDGVARVVGSTWTHHLPGTCIWDITAGPHGEVWVATWDGDMQLQQPGDAFVILPSAADA